MIKCIFCGELFGHKPGCPEEKGLGSLDNKPFSVSKDKFEVNLPPYKPYRSSEELFENKFGDSLKNNKLEPLAKLPKTNFSLMDLFGTRYDPTETTYEIPKHNMAEEKPFDHLPNVELPSDEKPNFASPITGMVKTQLGIDTGIRFMEGGVIKNDQGVLLGRIENNQIFNDYGHKVGSINADGQILDVNGIPTGEILVKNHT